MIRSVIPVRARTGRRAARVAAAALLVLLLGACSREEPAAGPPTPTAPGSGGADPTPPPSAAIRGFVSRSRLVFESRPEWPRVLEATYSLPDRARWRIEPLQQQRGRRRLIFRRGSSVFRLDPGSDASQPVVGAERDLLLLQIELRRAATLWPEGVDWSEENGAAVAALPGLGRIEALLGPDGRPVELRSYDAAGELRDALCEIAWHELRGRPWPASWRLEERGNPVWRESIESIETQADFLDVYFVPPDRRPPVEGTNGLEVFHLDLPARMQMRIPLPGAAGLEQALGEAGRLRSSWSARLAEEDLELAPSSTLELDWSGRPRAVLLVLSDLARPSGEGWELTPPRTALGRELGALAEVGPALLEDLAHLAAAGSRPAAPLLQVGSAGDAVGGAERARVVLPLVPRE